MVEVERLGRGREVGYSDRLEGVVRGVVTSNLVVTTQGGVVTTPPF